MFDQCVRLRVPATCGELIQGPYLAKESLISLPIDCYSVVEAGINFSADRREANCRHFFKNRLYPLPTKAKKAFSLATTYLELDPKLVSKIGVTLYSELDTGKGFATSTSDVYGVMAAVFELFGRQVEPEIYAKLCSDIEPTDGLMFRTWTLFDHLNGLLLQKYDVFENIRLLILEPETTCTTELLRTDPEFQQALSFKTARPFETFKKGMESGDLVGIFNAATQSALENQSVMVKPYLDRITQLSKIAGGYGVVAAHSGTLLGIALPEHVDSDRLLRKFEDYGILKCYASQFMARTVQGGHDMIKGGSTCL